MCWRPKKHGTVIFSFFINNCNFFLKGKGAKELIFICYICTWHHIKTWVVQKCPQLPPQYSVTPWILLFYTAHYYGITPPFDILPCRCCGFHSIHQWLMNKSTVFLRNNYLIIIIVIISHNAITTTWRVRLETQIGERGKMGWQKRWDLWKEKWRVLGEILCEDFQPSFIESVGHNNLKGVMCIFSPK